jgi:hypothetical protein
MYAARTYSNDAFDMTREAIRKPPPLIARDAILPVTRERADARKASPTRYAKKNRFHRSKG